MTGAGLGHQRKDVLPEVPLQPQVSLSLSLSLSALPPPARHAASLAGRSFHVSAVVFNQVFNIPSCTSLERQQFFFCISVFFYTPRCTRLARQQKLLIKCLR